jgi:hypothetical protein
LILIPAKATAAALSDTPTPAHTPASVAVAGQRFPAIPAQPIEDDLAPAAVILIDEDTLDRVEALERYWRALHEASAPQDPRLTRQRRHRLRYMIQAIDGHQAGATYREIAEAVLADQPIPAGGWVGDALRETTIRLVRDGLELVMGGYRNLFRRFRRRIPLVIGVSIWGVSILRALLRHRETTRRCATVLFIRRRAPATLM